MSAIKILGIGSPFGADQAGWLVIDRLQTGSLSPLQNTTRIMIEKHDRPGVRLLELMQDTSKVFIVDAVMRPHPAPAVVRLMNDEINELRNILSTHDVGIAQALELGRALKMLPDEIIFYGIAIESGMTDCLSIEKNILQAAEQLAQEIAGHFMLSGTSRDC